MADNLTSWQPISKRRSGVWGCGDPPVRGLPSSHIMGCALLALLVVGVVAQASVLHARPSSHTLTSQQEAALNPSGGTYLRRALAAWSIWGARRTSSASSRPPPAAVSLTVGTPVAIINPVNWHLEMVCSFMHLVSSVVGADNMTVYQETVGIRNSGFMELVQPLAHTVRLLPAPMDRHKLLIFISPEYRVNLTRIAIEQSQPEEVLLVVHNGDTTVLDELLELHPRIRVITLAPHVRRYLIQRQMKQRKAVHPAIIQGTWMLPVWPWVPEEPCPTHKLHDCLSGFSMQGKIASGRRKYGYVFEQLQQARDICKARPRCAKEVQHLNLQVVGKLKENLTMPDDVAPMVTIHNNLRYQQFYQTLYKTYALIPAMQNSAYFDRKFSSTVVTSLITGTPMVVDKDILHAYPILFQEDVLLQPEGEDGVTDAMVQILTFSSEQLAAKRAAVLRLRDFLNKDAQIKLREVLRSTHGLVSVTTLL